MPAKRAYALFLLAIVVLLMTACGSSTATGSGTPTANSNSTTTPVASATAQATSSPSEDPQTVATPTPPPAWKTYQSSFFTLNYPAGWVFNVIQPGSNGGLYAQQVEFRPAASSPITFTISTLLNAQVSPDLLLQNDPLYKSCKIESTSQVTVDHLIWSTAIGETQGTQLAHAKIEIAYANHKNSYRVSFSTPPPQFASDSPLLNQMFQSFQEK